MAVLVSLLLLLAVNQISADRVTDGTELVFSFMIHRHGDRTPVPDSSGQVSATYNQDVIEDLIAPWGYGQLTNLGRQRAYRLGKFIRRRYNGLLSDKYNRSEIYIRSTDSTRTKMTVLTAMAAVYPALGDTWSQHINWVPVPYTTVPAKYDYNLFTLNCPVFASAFMNLLYSLPASMSKHSKVLRELSSILGFDYTAYPVITYGLYDIYVSLQNLGYKLSKDVLKLMPALKSAANDAIDVILDNDDYIPYQAGPLLNEFFESADSVIAGEATPRVRVYSAHDTNVFSLTAATGVAPRQGVPRYASLYSLELRRVTETGRFVVLPVYLSTPEEPEIYLQVTGCGGLLCDLESFRDIVSKNVLSEDEWRTQCGFTPDMKIDTSGID